MPTPHVIIPKTFARIRHNCAGTVDRNLVRDVVRHHLSRAKERHLNAACWDADAVRDDLRSYVVDRLGGADGVLVVDETAFVKQGRASAGGAAARTRCPPRPVPRW